MTPVVPLEVHFVQLLGAAAMRPSLFFADQARLLGDLHFALQTSGAEPSLLRSLSETAVKLDPRDTRVSAPLLQRLRNLYQGSEVPPLVHPLEDPREKGRIDYPLPPAFRAQFVSRAESCVKPTAYSVDAVIADLGPVPDRWRKFCRATLEELRGHLDRMEYDSVSLQQDDALHGDYLAERFNNTANSLLVFKDYTDANTLEPEDVSAMKKAVPVIADILLLALDEARLPDSVLFHQFWKKAAVSVKTRFGDILEVLRAHPPR